MYQKKQILTKRKIAVVQTTSLLAALLAVSGQAETTPKNQVATPTSKAEKGDLLDSSAENAATTNQRVSREVASKKASSEGKALTHEKVRHAAGMTVYRDPVTGEFTSPPADAPSLLTDLPDGHSLSTSSKGLTEESSLGGGTMIRLQGRFQNATVASVDEDGHAATQCQSSHHAEEQTHDANITSTQEKE